MPRKCQLGPHNLWPTKPNRSPPATDCIVACQALDNRSVFCRPCKEPGLTKLPLGCHTRQRKRMQNYARKLWVPKWKETLVGNNLGLWSAKGLEQRFLNNTQPGKLCHCLLIGWGDTDGFDYKRNWGPPNCMKMLSSVILWGIQLLSAASFSWFCYTGPFRFGSTIRVDPFWHYFALSTRRRGRLLGTIETFLIIMRCFP